MFAIGIDIGGTKIAIGIVDLQGKLKAKVKITTDKTKDPNEILVEIKQQTEKLMESEQLSWQVITGVGIGAPGPINKKEGIIACPPNLPKWRNIEVVSFFKNAWNVPISFENDATAATLAEGRFGAAQGHSHYIFVTISTGIGAGLYANGQLISGAFGNAGDIGHIVIDHSKGICVCGQRGCFEWLASGTAIARRATEQLGRDLDTKEVFAIYHDGHEEMTELIEETYEYIGIGLVSLINMFEPEKIVVGGGVSLVGEPLFSAVQQYVSKYALSPFGRKTKIVPAELKQEAGIIGAASLVLK
ncbi:ROK family protein [Alkalihalobacillus sp. LMS39]|uniref:ROK family protein n=1 Tax=Alkalihalobacillus sp. LMS39 TaxID=2924032 RepID=UPI001FB2BC9B|nr:ROK family protein [Alkalihalobacillus sp. LMS39]UOE93552.1 ROK family protein [Alkalihalobacillus sp. LMS39]